MEFRLEIHQPYTFLGVAQSLNTLITRRLLFLFQPLRKQHGKRGKTLFRFGRQHFFHIYWSLWRQFSCKKSLLVTCKISKPFPNTLSADCKCFLLNGGNLTEPIQIQLSQTQKTFSLFFSAFLKSSWNFEFFQKKIPKLRTPKNMVRWMSKNGAKLCWNLNGSTFTIFIDHCEGRWLAKSPC